MKKFLLLALTACLPFITISQTSWQWGSVGGSLVSEQGPGNFIDETIQSMATDQHGNVYATARIAGEAYVGGDTSMATANLYVAISWACDGSVRWMKTLGSSFVRGLAVDTLGGVYITGFMSVQNGNYFDADTVIPPQGNNVLNGNFIVKYDTSGNFQWLHMPDPTIVDILTYSNKPRYVDIEAAPNGDLHLLTYLTADAHENGAYTTANPGYHVMKFDKEGNFLGGSSLPIMVNFDNNGAPLETTIDMSKFNMDPVVGRYYITGAVQTGSSMYDLYVGNDTLKSHTWPRIYTTSFDLSGNLKWYRIQDSANNGGVGGTATDRHGNLYIAGQIWNNDAWNGDVVTGAMPMLYMVACMDTNGVNKWISGGYSLSNGTAMASSIAVSKDDVIRVTGPAANSNTWGSFTLTAPPVVGCTTQTSGVFLARLDPLNGNCIALDSARSKCGFLPSANNTVTDLHGNFYIGGMLRNPPGGQDTQLYVGNDALVAIGGTTDFFIVKYGEASCEPLPASVANAASIKKLTLYPNPVSDIINVIGNGAELDYTIYNSMGAKISAGHLSGNQTTIDVASFTVGFYYLQVVDKKGERGVFKFVKK